MRIFLFFVFAILTISCSDSPFFSKKNKNLNPELSKSKSIVQKEIFIPISEINSVKEYFNEFIKKRHFNGSIAVSKKGKIIFDTVSGYSNIKRRIKLEVNSVQQLASVTKPITATVILQLAQEGKLKISDTITKYLKELPEHYKQVTVKQLLSHRSGLSQYYYYCDHLIDNRTQMIYNDTVLCVMNFHNPEHNFQPGKRYNYCNTNYLLLASIIESIEKERYADVIKKRILDKCGMQNSFVFDFKKDSIPSNLVYGHTLWNKLFQFDYLDGIVGDKGLFSNAKEMLLFDKTLNSGELLNDSIKNIAFTPHNKIKHGKSYGLGWRIREHKELGKIVYHTGWWHGNRNIYIKIPKNEYTIVILSNSLRGSKYNMNDILEHFDFDPVNKQSKLPIF